MSKGEIVVIFWCVWAVFMAYIVRSIIKSYREMRALNRRLDELRKERERMDEAELDRVVQRMKYDLVKTHPPRDKANEPAWRAARERANVYAPTPANRYAAQSPDPVDPLLWSLTSSSSSSGCSPSSSASSSPAASSSEPSGSSSSCSSSSDSSSSSGDSGGSCGGSD